MKARKNNPLSLWLKLVVGLNVVHSLLMIGAYLATHISPNSIPHLAFLGLGYPILLLVSLLFMIFWLFVRKKLMLISLITVLIGFNHLRHFYAITLWQTELANPIKIMSFNVHVFDLYSPETREQNRDEIFDFLKTEANDVICFQEFFHQAGNAKFQTKELMIPAIDMPYYHERYTHELSNSRYFGVATFSKYPIINKGEIAFENDPNNYCIYSDIARDTDTIRVFNGHLGSIRLANDDYEFFGEDGGTRRYLNDDTGRQQILSRLKNAFQKRAIQAEKVAAEIEQSPYPVVFCGDINDTPVSYSYSCFINLLHDSFVESGNGIGQTYIGKVPSNRIDYIFHSEEFESANFTTHDVNLSDHKPVSVQLEIEKE